MSLELVQAQAKQWVFWDKNEQDRKEIQELLDENNTDELKRRFRKRITFGTAGLRARMEAGAAGMNDMTVIQASQGLCEYLLANVPETKERGVIFGYDHRHNSKRFARLSAAAFLRRGVKVYFFDKFVHTPLVPFAVDFLRAAGGVMITASHNPAQDNGYKVYWENGCQIIPPHDSGIARAIDQNLAPEVWDQTLVDTDELSIKHFTRQVEKAYYETLAWLPLSLPKIALQGRPKFVYTPLHGIGLPFAENIFRLVGVDPSQPTIVKEQAEPNPDFPTVKFPNPEEKGALDLAIQTADNVGASLVVANDPDADRFSAAVKSSKTGKWTQLTGNQIGLLFAYFVYQEYVKKGLSKSKLYMINSAVSSRSLQAFAKAEGFNADTTLTGFKWIGNRAIELEEQGFHVPFGFEEAIGYMFKGVHDKDGISALAMFLRLSLPFFCEAAGHDILEHLDNLYQRYGYYEDYNSYYFSSSPDLTAMIFASIRNLGEPYPQEIKRADGNGVFKVTYWRDLTLGYDSSTPDHNPVLPVSKNSEMISAQLDGGDVAFTCRGSGTEPKLKVYIEAKGDSSKQAKQLAILVWESLKQEWFRPDQSGLKLAHS